MAGPITPIPGGVRIAVKAVPGASRDGITGLLGERVKVRVAAAPEGGKANDAICHLLSAALGVPARNASVVTGMTGAEKTIDVMGVSEMAARAALGV